MKAGVLGRAVVKAGLRSAEAVNCLAMDGLKTDFSGGRGKLCCLKGLPCLGAAADLVKGFWPKEAKDGAPEFWEAVDGVSLLVSLESRGSAGDQALVAWSEDKDEEEDMDVRSAGGCCANLIKGLDSSTLTFWNSRPSIGPSPPRLFMMRRPGGLAMECEMVAGLLEQGPFGQLQQDGGVMVGCSSHVQRSGHRWVFKEES